MVTGQRGVALILAILVTSFLTAIGLGLMLIVFMDRLATGNLRGSVAMLHAADAAIELAARELAVVADWDPVLAGQVQGSLVDGPPGGLRVTPGGAIDLTMLTNQLNCGRSTACTAADMDLNTAERPWGLNNARWQLFSYGPWSSLAPLERPAACYVAVWVADDGREDDADPRRDAAAAGAPGAGVLRVRAEAYGPLGARRAIEAELARRCVPDGASCRPGIRVQSWQEVRHAIP